MLLDSMTMLAILIALTTSVAVITLAIRQNMLLMRENTDLRRALRTARAANHVYYDPDIAK
ncbi:MAG: hypothetical protein EBU08_15580, partial [Micrococcales bacterium]|nr:hypothetical protein [Micrococcales bacterium]